MPKRTDKDKEVTVNSGRKMAAPAKPRIAANGHKLPDKLPEGIVLTDVSKQSWILGPSIGVGGFGEIYLASDNINQPVNTDAKYVIKIEPHKNGPLFAEMHFYHRVGKEDAIRQWIKDHKLEYLGMPRFYGSGSHEHKDTKYRFMVMDRYSEDLQKILERNNRLFSIKNVFVLGIRIMDILEYIHSFGYIHADVKASNLLLGFGAENQNRVYLVDFGLACRYMANGEHKPYKEDVRKAHDGTIEFTSRDAHIGAHSRRGDLEILGYNMLQWLCGRLPWEDNLKNAEYVSHQKSGYMMNVPLLLKKCFPDDNYPKAIMTFLQYVAALQFDEQPDYDHCRNMFKSALKKINAKDMKLSFPAVKSPTKRTTHRSKSPIKKRTRTVIETPSCSEDDDIVIKGRKKGPRKERVLKDNDDIDLVAKKDKVTSARNRVKKTASATSGSSRQKYVEESSQSSVDETNNVSIEDQIETQDTSLENPTPAMLQVMQRKLEMAKEAKTKRKAFSANAAYNISDTYKEQVVQKYKEKSPELFAVSKKEEVKKPKRLPRSQIAKAATDRKPLATRPTQDSPPRYYRENSYSPEI